MAPDHHLSRMAERGSTHRGGQLNRANGELRCETWSVIIIWLCLRFQLGLLRQAVTLLWNPSKQLTAQQHGAGILEEAA